MASSMHMLRLISTAYLALILGCVVSTSEAARHPNESHATAFMHPTPMADRTAGNSKIRLVGPEPLPEPTTILDYHFGPIMTGRNGAIKLFVIYYGDFSEKQKSILRLFFKSFWTIKSGEESQSVGEDGNSYPTVAQWWKITREYVDLYNAGVAHSIVLGGETADKYSLGKNIKQSQIQDLVIKSMKVFGTDARSMYLVLTAPDVLVEKFCMSVCGSHFYTFPSDATQSQMVPYGWVGNAARQCPQMCCWPYAPGGTLKKPLIPPNADVGLDGMIITIANLIAGIATNAYNNGYYQAESGYEAAGVCEGAYGPNSFPGYPGELLVDKPSGASFNVYGEGPSKFLVPWIWNPSNQLCAGQA